MTDDVREAGERLMVEKRQMRARWARRPFRPLALLRCWWSHAGSVWLEWEHDQLSTSATRVRLVSAECGRCARPLRPGERARCDTCGSRVRYHQAPRIRTGGA